MTPEPAPYGADLPRPMPPGDEPCVLCNDSSRRCDICPDAEWRRLILHGYVPALDAANAEVLRLRAERDALREVVEAVREECANTYRYYPEWLVDPDAKFGARIYAQGRVATANLILENILPAPTEGDG